MRGTSTDWVTSNVGSSFPFLIAAVPPLAVIEFLHRIMDTFVQYFGQCTEVSIKDNYVVVYEVGVK